MARPPHKIVRGHTVPPRDTQGRREGFTTGTAAAAAAKAACLLLLDRGWPEPVSIQLPIPRVLELPINTLEWAEGLARCGVIKDAGADPVVTHGREILPSGRCVTAAWRASVLQAVDVAAANSIEHIILSTGGRTEKFARQFYPELPELAFVEMGIFTGASLQRAAERGVPRVSLCAMIGKLSKTTA